MAQIVMLEDHDGKKKGELVHMGCLDGRAMVQSGLAVYWDGKPVPQPSPMEIQAVPPLEIKVDKPFDLVTDFSIEFDDTKTPGNESMSDAELERLTAPKIKSKKHKQ